MATWALVLSLTVLPGTDAGWGSVAIVPGFATEAACQRAGHAAFKTHPKMDDFSSGKSFCISSTMPVRNSEWIQLYVWSKNTGFRSAFGGIGSIAGYTDEDTCKKDLVYPRINQQRNISSFDWAICLRMPSG